MKFTFDLQVPVETTGALRTWLYDLIRKLALSFNAKTDRTAYDDQVFDSATKGVVLKDTQSPAHYWRVTVSDVGALVVTDLGTTRP